MINLKDHISYPGNLWRRRESELHVPEVSCVKVKNSGVLTVSIRRASPEEPMKISHACRGSRYTHTAVLRDLEEGSGIEHLVQLRGSGKDTQRSYVDIIGMGGSYGRPMFPTSFPVCTGTGLKLTRSGYAAGLEGGGFRARKRSIALPVRQLGKLGMGT